MDQIGKTIYGGNRYLMDDFQGSIRRFENQLGAILPILEKFDVSVAIENHQDLHSLELVDIRTAVLKFDWYYLGCW